MLNLKKEHNLLVTVNRKAPDGSPSKPPSGRADETPTTSFEPFLLDKQECCHYKWLHHCFIEKNFIEESPT